MMNKIANQIATFATLVYEETSIGYNSGMQLLNISLIYHCIIIFDLFLKASDTEYEQSSMSYSIDNLLKKLIIGIRPSSALTLLDSASVAIYVYYILLLGAIVFYICFWGGFALQIIIFQKQKGELKKTRTNQLYGKVLCYMIFFGNCLVADFLLFPMYVLQNEEQKKRFSEWRSLSWFQIINTVLIVLIAIPQETYSCFCRSFIKSKENSLALGEIIYPKMYFLYQIGIIVGFIPLSIISYWLPAIIILMLQCGMTYICFTRSNFLNFQVDVYTSKILIFQLLLHLFLMIFQLSKVVFSQTTYTFFFVPYIVILWILSDKICLKLYNRIILQKDSQMQIDLLLKKIRMYLSVLINNQEDKGDSTEGLMRDLQKMIMGTIDSHREKCKDPNCICPKVIIGFSLYDPSTKEFLNYDKDSMDYFFNNRIFYKHLIASFLENYSKTSFQKSIKLKIFHTSFVFFELNLTSKAINQILVLKRNTSNYFLHQSLLSLEKKVCSHFETNRTSGMSSTLMSDLNISKLIHIEKIFYSLEEEIVNYFLLYDQMLKEIDSEIVYINRLKRIFRKLDNCLHSITRKFTSGVGQKNPRIVTLMISFYSIVMQEYDKAKDYLKKLELMKERINRYLRSDEVFFEEELMYNEGSTLLQIGALRENLGIIVDANKGAENLFGYKLDQIINKNIDMLIPSTIANIHQGFLTDYIDYGVSKVLYQERLLFGIGKSGAMIPLGVLVKPMLNIRTKSFLFVAYLQKKKGFYKYIMINNSGEIIGLDEELVNHFSKNPRTLYNQKIPIGAFQAKFDQFIDIIYDENMNKHKSTLKIDRFFKSMSSNKNKKQEVDDIFQVNEDKDFVTSFKIPSNEKSYSTLTFDVEDPGEESESRGQDRRRSLRASQSAFVSYNATFNFEIFFQKDSTLIILLKFRVFERMFPLTDRGARNNSHSKVSNSDVNIIASAENMLRGVCEGQAKIKSQFGKISINKPIPINPSINNACDLSENERELARPFGKANQLNFPNVKCLTQKNADSDVEDDNVEIDIISNMRLSKKEDELSSYGYNLRSEKNKEGSVGSNFIGEREKVKKVSTSPTKPVLNDIQEEDRKERLNILLASGKKGKLFAKKGNKVKMVDSHKEDFSKLNMAELQELENPEQSMSVLTRIATEGFNVLKYQLLRYRPKAVTKLAILQIIQLFLFSMIVCILLYFESIKSNEFSKLFDVIHRYNVFYGALSELNSDMFQISVAQRIDRNVYYKGKDLEKISIILEDNFSQTYKETVAELFRFKTHNYNYKNALANPILESIIGERRKFIYDGVNSTELPFYGVIPLFNQIIFQTIDKTDWRSLYPISSKTIQINEDMVLMNYKAFTDFPIFQQQTIVNSNSFFIYVYFVIGVIAVLSLVVLVLRIMGFKECYSFSDNLFYELSLLSIYECWVIRNKKLVECCEKVNEILSESNPKLLAIIEQNRPVNEAKANDNFGKRRLKEVRDLISRNIVAVIIQGFLASLMVGSILAYILIGGYFSDETNEILINLRDFAHLRPALHEINTDMLNYVLTSKGILLSSISPPSLQDLEDRVRLFSSREEQLVGRASTTSSPTLKALFVKYYSKGVCEDYTRIMNANSSYVGAAAAALLEEQCPVIGGKTLLAGIYPTATQIATRFLKLLDNTNSQSTDDLWQLNIDILSIEKIVEIILEEYTLALKDERTKIISSFHLRIYISIIGIIVISIFSYFIEKIYIAKDFAKE